VSKKIKKSIKPRKLKKIIKKSNHKQNPIKILKNILHRNIKYTLAISVQMKIFSDY